MTRIGLAAMACGVVAATLSAAGPASADATDVCMNYPAGNMQVWDFASNS